MIPSKLDLQIWRGTTFELELISQVKNYIYDPDIHTGALDLKRTHAENLEFYGYTYEYADFSTIYADAVLTVLKPWRQNSKEERTSLLELSLADGDIELTTTGIKIGMSDEETKTLTFDSGSYELKLITPAGKVDILIHGTLSVKGER